MPWARVPDTYYYRHAMRINGHPVTCEHGEHTIRMTCNQCGVTATSTFYDTTYGRIARQHKAAS